MKILKQSNSLFRAGFSTAYLADFLSTNYKFYIDKLISDKCQEASLCCRVLKGGCSRGGGNWGTLRIPREDWGTFGNIWEDYGNHQHPLRIISLCYIMR